MRESERSTPELVTQLFSRIADGNNIYIPLTTKIDYIRKLGKASRVSILDEGLLLPEDMRNELPRGVNIVSASNASSDAAHILMDPPFGLHIAEQKHGIRDQALIAFTDALRRIDTTHFGAITTPLGVTFKQRELDWLATLNHQGIYLQALIFLPAGTYESTNIPTVMLVLGRRPRKKYLSIELNQQNYESTFTRVMNWLLGEAAAQNDTSLFDYVEGRPLMTADKIRRQNMLNKLMQSNGYPVHNILDNAEIRSSRQGQFFDDQPNTIYLPNIGNSQVVTSSDDMTMKNESNYFQIILDPKIDASYVARWLNTTAGQLARKNLLSGNFIQKISLSSLNNGLLVPLPSPVGQRNITALHSRISDAISELQSLQLQLDTYPRRLRTTESSFEQMIQTNPNSWIELLPAHLSILLRKYLAAQEAEKYERLLKFFEALNHTFAAIYMTYLRSNEKLWDHFIETNQALDMNLVFDRSNFGSWYAFMSVAQNYLRRSRARKGGLEFPNRSIIDQSIGLEDDELIDAILSSKISSVCEKAHKKRNIRAHEFDISNNLQLLTGHLDEVRTILITIFSSYKMISYKQGRAGESEFRPYTVNSLHGSSVAFDDMDIELENGMNESSIYLYELGSLRIKKLHPILVIEHGPSNVRNTIYYYDHPEPGGSIYKPYAGGEPLQLPYEVI